jgi:hypothetical protein
VLFLGLFFLLKVPILFDVLRTLDQDETRLVTAAAALRKVRSEYNSDLMLNTSVLGVVYNAINARASAFVAGFEFFASSRDTLRHC